MFCFWFIGLVHILFLFRLAGTDVDYDEQCHNGKEHDSRKSVDLRLDAALCHCIDLDGKCGDTAARCEEGDDKVIDRHCECQDRTGYDTRGDLRNDNAPECSERRCAQIYSRFVGVFIELTKFWHYRQYHVRDIECDVGEKNCDISQIYLQECEEEEEGDTGYDIGIEHRDVGSACEDSSRSAL